MLELSQDAKRLLKSAIESTGRMWLVRASGPSGPYFYLRIQQQPPAFAKGSENSDIYLHWKSVLDELLTEGMVRPIYGGRFPTYEVTELGREVGR